ncbi:inositol monophosphatase family protein [Roseomonas marmotae]|uniref:Inositol monophosphatase family protein n=1 Tax=Roseomonas marmotae TaxID=2768161 RepID=A0ABS3KF61_9PROT|nr:inositol monophosphatase family protein [Roseomonas marmotae]MBO1075288.1 inositol monophosphatase family protein [Roseomonas marmotae]QTI78269.1 inositol monophosphatase family protein [Roseomonas marmotae]
MRFDHRMAGDVATILRDATRAEILPRFRRLPAGAIRTKSGPTDLVTDADEAAERQITRDLLARFPGCVVVGEEAQAADPGLLARLAGVDLTFVVDPVDGTANFAAGVPLFGCMAAAVVKGEVVASWIHDPLGDDTAVALRGEGAWIEHPQYGRTELKVAAPVPVERMTGAVSWTWMTEPVRSRVTSRLSRLASGVQFRCAAHEYRLVASGGAHFTIYNKLMPWDHLPGWLLHREAGGYSARFDGSEYLPTHTGGGLIAAPDKASWQAIKSALLDE